GDLAGGEPRQIAALLRLGAVRDERIPGRVLHEIDDGGGRTGPRDLLHGEAERERPEPGAAVGLGDVEAHQPLRAEETQLLGGVRLRLVHLRGERRDALAGQRARQLAGLDESKRDRGVSVSGAGGKFYVLPATLDTTQRGWLDPKEPPKLVVNSGDTVASTCSRFRARSPSAPIPTSPRRRPARPF